MKSNRSGTVGRPAGRAATSGRRRPSAGTGRAARSHRRVEVIAPDRTKADRGSGGDRPSGRPPLTRPRPGVYIADDISRDGIRRRSDQPRPLQGARSVRGAVALHPRVAQRWAQARVRDHDRRRGDLRGPARTRHPLRGARPAGAPRPHRSAGGGGPAPAVPTHRAGRRDPARPVCSSSRGSPGPGCSDWAIQTRHERAGPARRDRRPRPSPGRPCGAPRRPGGRSVAPRSASPCPRRGRRAVGRRDGGRHYRLRVVCRSDGGPADPRRHVRRAARRERRPADHRGLPGLCAGSPGVHRARRSGSARLVARDAIPPAMGVLVNVRALSQRCPHLGCRPNPCLRRLLVPLPVPSVALRPSRHQGRRRAVRAGAARHGPVRDGRSTPRAYCSSTRRGWCSDRCRSRSASRA